MFFIKFFLEKERPENENSSSWVQIVLVKFDYVSCYMDILIYRRIAFFQIEKYSKLFLFHIPLRPGVSVTSRIFGATFSAGGSCVISSKSDLLHTFSHFFLTV